MYLVNTQTKHCVCIAVHFGHMAEDMYRALADEQSAFMTGWPSQAWRIEYEHADEQNPGPEHDWQSCLTCTGKYKIGQREPVL